MHCVYPSKLGVYWEYIYNLDIDKLNAKCSRLRKNRSFYRTTVLLNSLYASCTSLKKLFLSEVNTELTKHSGSSTDIITEKEIASLPEPVQKYFRHCGYIGREKMINAKIEWKDVYFRLSAEKKWMSLDCYQFNFVPEPTRIVYMKSKIIGIFPFEARDKYQNGHGNMLIKFLKFVTVADAKSKEMDESALVTILAETLLVPSYALQDYIKWTAIDSKSAKAILTFNGSEVNGIFYFNEQNEFIRFETNDRYYSGKGIDYKKVKWSAVAGNYLEKNGIKFPTDLKATWHHENRDFEYFKGNIEQVEFNVKK
jgi:hypothetical protein